MNHDIKQIKKRLNDIKVFALDMDGTIYLGNELFSFTKEFLEGLQKAGKKFIFLTNNSSKNSTDYLGKLEKMGLQVSKDDIYTSGDATIEYLKDRKSEARIYLLGTDSLKEDFKKAGFKLTSQNPDFVVLGFDLGFNYKKFDAAARFIRQGVPFIATHPDLNCPIEGGDMLPDCGAMSAAITAATEIEPKVIGKPNQEMLNGLLRKVNCTKDDMCVVGDRLTTDIKMGHDFGIFTILVLTGETKKQDIAGIHTPPDLVLERNIDILRYLE